MDFLWCPTLSKLKVCYFKPFLFILKNAIDTHYKVKCWYHVPYLLVIQFLPFQKHFWEKNPSIIFLNKRTWRVRPHWTKTERHKPLSSKIEQTPRICFQLLSTYLVSSPCNIHGPQGFAATVRSFQSIAIICPSCPSRPFMRKTPEAGHQVAVPKSNDLPSAIQ